MTPTELLELVKVISAEREAKEQAQNAPRLDIQTSVNQHGAVVGDVLTSIWGYDQTNYDFYEVIKVTAKTVTVKKLTSWDAGTIYKNRTTKRYTAGCYRIRIDEVKSATFNVSDPKAKQRMAEAEEELNQPGHYR